MSTELERQLDRDVVQLLRLLGGFEDMHTAMTDARPGLEAAAYDTDHGGSVAWCDRHERPVTTCHRTEDPSMGRPFACVGVPLPKLTDPTGDDAAAAAVFEDVRQLGRSIGAIHREVATLVKLQRRYRRVDPTPQQQSELEDSNKPLCERHLRYGFERESRTKNGTQVPRGDGSHVLTEKHRLCKWCEEATERLGHMPTEWMIRDHEAGKRLRVPVDSVRTRQTAYRG